MNEQQEEWYDWLDHNGKGKPVPEGTFVEGEYRCGETDFWIVGSRPIAELPGPGLGWDWGAWDMNDGPQPYDIVRYRIRKPRGLSMLQGMIADVPQEVNA